MALNQLLTEKYWFRGIREYTFPWNWMTIKELHQGTAQRKHNNYGFGYVNDIYLPIHG